MGTILWIFTICAVLAVQLSVCTSERNETTDVNIYPPPLLFCNADGVKSVLAPIKHLLEEIVSTKNDYSTKKDLLRQVQDRWRILTWYKIQYLELDRLNKLWSTLKPDSDSEKKRSEYMRVRVMLQTTEEFFFPLWLTSGEGSFTRYEKWVIGFSMCQEKRWETFRQAINVKYGSNTTKNIMEISNAISELYSEVSLETPYYNTILEKAPETDNEITDLCSSVAEPTIMKHYACKLAVMAQSSLGVTMITRLTDFNPYPIFYGIIKRSMNTNKTSRVITELFTSKDPSAMPMGVENCVVNVNLFDKNTNLIAFYATCPKTVKSKQLKEKLSPLIKPYVADLGQDFFVFQDDLNS